MAWTQSDIDALRSAIAGGVLSVRYADTSVTYQSLPEMRALLAEMENAVNATRPRRTLATFGSGV